MYVYKIISILHEYHMHCTFVKDFFGGDGSRKSCAGQTRQVPTPAQAKESGLGHSRELEP